MSRYITIPLDTDPETLLLTAIAYIQSKFPDWQPIDGNLDTSMLEAAAAQAADAMDVASRVPDTIFRQFGLSLVNVPPIDASYATGSVTFFSIDALGHTIAAGTAVGIRDSQGDLIGFYTLADVVIPPGSAQTTVGGVTVTAAEPGADSSGLGVAGADIELIDPLTWVSHVRLETVTSGGIDAEADDDYLDRLRTELQLLTPRPILPADFAVLARKVSGVFRAVAIDNYNPRHNLLTANEASIETSAAGWSALANVTLAQSTTFAADGVNSLRMTATAAADMSAVLAASKVTVPGETYTARAEFRAGSVGRSIKVGIQWRDAGDALISTVFGTIVADVTGAFTMASVTAVAPATAVNRRIVLYVVTPGAGEIHYADKMSSRHGTGTDWVAGDTLETGVERYVTVAAVDTLGNPVSGTVKTAIQSYLDALRETSFVVETIDPQVTAIDVTFQVTVLDGFTATDVVTRAVQAVTDFLSKSTWGNIPGDLKSWVNSSIVDRGELFTVINNVAGVNRATTLTLAVAGGSQGTANVTLPGIVPLATAGTIVGTAV